MNENPGIELSATENPLALQSNGKSRRVSQIGVNPKNDEIYRMAAEKVFELSAAEKGFCGPIYFILGKKFGDKPFTNTKAGVPLQILKLDKNGDETFSTEDLDCPAVETVFQTAIDFWTNAGVTGALLLTMFVPTFQSFPHVYEGEDAVSEEIQDLLLQL
jgi:hypothetical protein